MKRPLTRYFTKSRFPLSQQALLTAMVVLSSSIGSSTHVGRSALAFAPVSSLRNNNKRPRVLSTSLKEQKSIAEQQQQHFVLIGGGHSHVQVIKALNAQARPSHLKVTLIDAQKSASYSGMVPGCIADYYTPEETQLHLEPLAAWAGMDFVHDRVVDIDLEQKLVYTRNDYEQPIKFDAISMDIGSTSRDLDVVPGARHYTIPTRPIDKLISRLQQARIDWQEEQQKAAAAAENSSNEKPRVVVVGGGAAGVELSMAIASRWKDLQPEMTLLDGGSELMPSESPAARNKLRQVLNEKGINVLHDCTVKCVEDDYLELEGDTNRIIPFTHCIWATGAGAHPLAHHLHNVRGLDTTKRGWITVHDTLRSTSHPFVFAGGDCCEIQGLAQGPPAKAGVFAVRAGPILTENLTRYLDGQRKVQQRQTEQHDDGSSSEEQRLGQPELIQYKPQDDFLKLIVCGDGKALGFRFGMAFYGKWVFQMKDQIDQGFMDLFRVEHLPKLGGSSSSSKDEHDDTTKRRYDTTQYDAKLQDVNDRIRLDPQEAAELLHRTDDGVDFQEAWQVIRDMADDDAYRQRVQHAAASATSDLITRNAAPSTDVPSIGMLQ